MPTTDKPKILIVNDKPACMLALSSLLEQGPSAASYTVLTARSGQQAVAAVQQHDFAVIILSLDMADMDGFDTAAAIHQGAADLPIIFTSASLADEIARLEAYEHGAADFMFVPVIPQILHAKVATFVALAHKSEQLQRQTETLAQHARELTATNQRLLREIAEREVAERHSHAKDEFLAMLGHELRNPLSAISSAAALIDMPGADQQTVGRARQIIQRQSQHLAHIVDDLLDLARAMSGKVLLSTQAVNLASLVGACLDTFRATGRTSGYRIHVDLAPHWVDGDPTRLEQIATNLIDNALKYTPPGGAIDITISESAEQILLTVQDSGIGISAELLPHVFDVFVQGAIGLDRAQGGLGIGLTLVRQLVELHGGSVSAASSGSRQGSTFTICLPRAAALPASDPAGRPAAPSQARPAVLLIEDNDDGREMMATMLDVYGYPVLQSGDGLAGVALATEHLPNVALVDIGLPGIDGYEVARRLRANPATGAMRLIALTGYGLAEDQRRVLEAGFDMHLVKPVDIAQLLGALGEPAPLPAATE